ncbi:hypothetical protein [Haloarcula sp. Atlit-7R]|nr:hypothetical protein [Haloarcula sp. Atlit-7R]
MAGNPVATARTQNERVRVPKREIGFEARPDGGFKRIEVAWNGVGGG